MGSMVLAKTKALMSTKFISNILVHDRQVPKFKPRKLSIRRNNNKVDSIETGPIVIAHLLP